jgi:2'-5' RNA ligase
VTASATVAGDARVRLFLALEIPPDAARRLGSWAREELTGGRVPETFHVTLAFLGYQPCSRIGDVRSILREESWATASFVLEPVGYRETRSVGMLVLADGSGEATALARRLHARLEALGVYEPEQRAWLPHVTVLRFRVPPRLHPSLPAIGPFAPSGAAAFLSRLHPSGARYEVLESCSLGNGESGG